VRDGFHDLGSARPQQHLFALPEKTAPAPSPGAAADYTNDICCVIMLLSRHLAAGAPQGQGQRGPRLEISGHEVFAQTLDPAQAIIAALSEQIPARRDESRVLFLRQFPAAAPAPPDWRPAPETTRPDREGCSFLNSPALRAAVRQHPGDRVLQAWQRSDIFFRSYDHDAHAVFKPENEIATQTPFHRKRQIRNA